MKFRKNEKYFTVEEVVSYNRQIYKEKEKEFLSYFNLNLKNFLTGNLKTSLTGFDLIKFDKTIKTPNGISTKNWIKKQYGSKAQDLISWLIKNTGLPK